MGGPFKGHYPTNVDRDIFLVCSKKEGWDDHLFERLHTTITLAGMYDIIEAQEAHRSHEAAMSANLRLLQDQS